MASVVNVEHLTGVMNPNGVQGTDILGHIVWYNVSQMLLKPEEVEAKLKGVGLGTEYMPNPIRVVDAYRRATAIKRKVPTDKANVFMNYMCREVYADSEVAVRHLVTETVDQEGKRLDYNSEAAKITLDKKTEALIFEYTDWTTQFLCEEIERNFNIFKDHYSEQQLRIMVAKILSSMAPTALRKNGGVYFVPEKFSEQLSKFTKFVTNLTEESNGFKVPVVDTFDNRQMVTHTLKDQLNGIFNECKSSLGKGLKKSVVKELIANAKKASDDFKNYKQLLVAEEQESIGNLLEQIRQMMIQLTVEIEG